MATNLRPVIRAIYNAVAPVLLSGGSCPVRCDVDGVLLARIVGPAPTGASLRYNSVTAGVPLVKQGVIKASAGFLRLIEGRSDDAAATYLLLFNKAANAVNNDVPDWPAFPIPTTAGGTPFGFEFGDGMALPAGIAWASSTTSDKLTLPAVASYAVGALYI